MQRLSVLLLAALASVSLVLFGCAQAQPAPTQAPPAPTKAAAPATAAAPSAVPVAPTKAPQPTAAPAKLNYPEKGKPITFLVGFAAGGAGDLSARLLADSLERELGASVQVVNKVGASSQVALTELAQAKPDGYTIGQASLPTGLNTYLDPERKATYNGNSFQKVANQAFDPVVVAVSANGPYKSMKDLIDQAKASPEKVKIGTSGILSAPHLTGLLLGKVIGAKFAFVHFDGTAPATVSMLGGNLDVVPDPVPTFLSHVKNGQVRILGVADNEETSFYPGVKTLQAQGYDVKFGIAKGVVMPAGTPREIVNVLSNAIKKIMTTDSGHKEKMQQLGSDLRYMDPDQYATYWNEIESQMKPLLPLAKQQ